MISLLCSSALAADSEPEDRPTASSDTMTHFQEIMMYKLLITQQFGDSVKSLPAMGMLDHVGRYNNGRDACIWEGVYCSQGAVRRIKWNASRWRTYCWIDLRWIPGTVREFHLSGSILHRAFTSRLLPDGLQDFRLSHIDTNGMIDFSTLPSSLISLHLNSCSLSGTLDITQLPRNLKDIEMLRNRGIEKIFVCDDVLPEEIDIQLTNFSRSNVEKPTVQCIGVSKASITREKHTDSTLHIRKSGNGKKL